MIRSNEPAQCICIQATVRVRDQSQGNGVNPRIVFEFALSEFWELVVVALWKIFANLSQLLFDDVKVIDEPLGGR